LYIVRTDLLVGLIIVTLAINVVLGVELYNALNRPVTLGQSANATLPITVIQGSNYNNVTKTAEHDHDGQYPYYNDLPARV